MRGEVGRHDANPAPVSVDPAAVDVEAATTGVDPATEEPLPSATAAEPLPIPGATSPVPLPAPPSRPKRVGYVEILRIRPIRVAAIGTFVIMLGFGILSPILPLYARSFHVGYGAVGLLASSFAFTRLLLDLVCGGLIARFGERAMVTIGAIVVGVTSALAAVAPNFSLLVLFRGLGGAGSAVYFAAMMSFLFRVAPKEWTGRVMGVFFGAFNAGFILGTPLGGVVAHFFGLASPLWFYAGSCFIAAAVYAKLIRDPEPSDDHEERRPGIRSLRFDRPFVAVLAANLAYFWMTGAVFITLLSLFGREGVGFSPLGVALASGVAVATEFAAQFAAGSLADRRGRRAVLVPAFVALAIATGALGFATSALWFIVAAGIFGVTSGFGGIPVPAMLSDVVPEDRRPAAIGVYRFVGDLGMVLGPLVAGGAASAYGFKTAFVLSGVPCLLAAALLASIPETLKRPVEG